MQIIISIIGDPSELSLLSGWFVYFGIFLQCVSTNFFFICFIWFWLGKTNMPGNSVVNGNKLNQQAWRWRHYFDLLLHPHNNHLCPDSSLINLRLNWKFNSSCIPQKAMDIPDSDIGWPNVGPTSVLSSRRWTNVGPTNIAGSDNCLSMS